MKKKTQTSLTSGGGTKSVPNIVKKIQKMRI